MKFPFSNKKTKTKGVTKKKKKKKGTKAKPFVPNTPTVNKAKRVNGVLEIEIPELFLGRLVAMAAQGAPDEIQAWGWLADDELLDLYKIDDADESTGHVTGNTAEVIAYSISKGLNKPNIQIHTHPFGSVFWSATDLLDHERHLAHMLATGKGAEFTFLVYSGGTKSLVRRYKWDDGGKNMTYQEGHLTCNGVALPSQRTTYKQGKGGYTQYPWWDDEDWGEVWLGKKAENQPHLLPAPDDPPYPYARQQTTEIPPIGDGPDGNPDPGVLSWVNGMIVLGNEKNYILPHTHRRDYLELFEMLGVDPYDFETLRNLIEESSPGKYMDVLRAFLEDPYGEDDEENWIDIVYHTEEV